MPAVAAEPRAQGAVRCSGGRSLAYAEFGSADGVPVLFVPGAATSRLMNFGGPVLAERGVRLISVDRPGLGGSDLDADGTFLSFAADIDRLLGHLGIQSPVCVANSQGAPFGLACAQRGVVSALVLVSPADEVAHDAVRVQLPAEFQDLVRQVADDPRSAERRFAEFDADSMFAFVLSSVPEGDAEIYRSPAFVDLYRRALAEGFIQGAAGYAHDTRLAMSPWMLDLAALVPPVSIWFGLDDFSHSPDRGVTLAKRIPGSRLHHVAGVGGSLLWRTPAAILADVLTLRTRSSLA